MELHAGLFEIWFLRWPLVVWGRLAVLCRVEDLGWKLEALVA